MKTKTSFFHFPSFLLPKGGVPRVNGAGWSNLLPFLSAAFILATLITIGIQHRRINRLQQQNQLKAIELSTLKDTVAVYQDKNGELTYKLSVVEVNNRKLKESLEMAGFDIKKLKEKDIAWRKVTAALRAQIAATGSVSTTVTDTFRVENTDTVYYQRINPWSNQFLSIFDGEIIKHDLNFDYRYTTGIDFLTTGTRRETVVSVMLSDPNASITTGNSITVNHKKRIWEKGWLWAAVGLGAGILITR